MEATVEHNLINPDSAVEIQVERNEDDSGNDNEVINLSKSDSAKSDDDIALVPLQTSIVDTGKDLKSVG